MGDITSTQEENMRILMTLADINRFWNCVELGEAGDCWPWKRGLSGVGYGQFYLPKAQFIEGARVPIGAHRLAKALFDLDASQAIEIELDGDTLTCHDCPGGDNRACCNPGHLFLGSRRDNNIDAMAKGAILPVRFKSGSAHHGAKISEADVAAIREHYANGAGGRDISACMGISLQIVQRVVSGKCWGHVPVPAETQAKLDRRRGGGHKFRRPGTKLSDDQAERIRALYAQEGFTLRGLASQFQCSYSTIADVIHNRTHVAAVHA
jgi:hypothetical protein